MKLKSDIKEFETMFNKKECRRKSSRFKILDFIIVAFSTIIKFKLT